MMNHLAIVGATGLVGSCFLDLIKEKGLKIQNLRLFASKKNKGKTIRFNETDWPIQTLKPGCFKDVQVAFFSAGNKISREWAKKACEEGCFVIDNSSAFRMEKDIPLIVPEINLKHLLPSHKLIANPNCSTIQMCLVLHPLHQSFGIESVQVATYQSMSGAGAKPLNQLKEESLSALKKGALHDNLAFNCIPQIGEINVHGFSTEDIKMQEETKKILDHPTLRISAFTVRVPTLISHGEVLWLRLKKEPKDKQNLITTLQKQKGLQVAQAPDNKTTTGQDSVYVGRIHQAEDGLWMMWISGDNLRKGAALNALQISQQIGL